MIDSYLLPASRVCRCAIGLAVCLSLLATFSETRAAELPGPVVLTQLPAEVDVKQPTGRMLRADYGEGARLVVLLPNATVRVRSKGFHSACDPDVSFDGKRILFAGKRTAGDPWNIFEMTIDGSEVRQITRGLGDCRSPGYQSRLYTIVSSEPWRQLTFVGSEEGLIDEFTDRPATSLYSCKLDGSAVRRLTFNLSSDMDPFLMSDGRILFAAWQRRTLDHGPRGRIGLFGVNIDGTDYALFAGYEGRRIKHMPCAAAGGLVVFVEADRVPWDGAGMLSCVQVRRPLHSYRPITEESDGLFHSPSPLPDGTLLVSRRPADGSATHGICRMDPVTKRIEPIFDDPRYHEIQAKLIVAREIPDGRSSVVQEEDPHGKLYCLNVYTTDLKQREWLPSGTAKRLRVLEGIAPRADEAVARPPGQGRPFQGGRFAGFSVNGIPPLAQRRVLGEVPLGGDGSFNVEVPANMPVELQLLDADGIVLRSCGWIWAKNREPRGCVGCHEDGELTPENWFMGAFRRPSIKLGVAKKQRKTVDFRRDVMPIIEAQCVACHSEGKTGPFLDGGMDLVKHPRGGAYFNRAYVNLLGKVDAAKPYKRYVYPGKARISPLVWKIVGRNTSRPWDAAAAKVPFEKSGDCRADQLTDDEKLTFIEWIDMGALWDGIPGADNLSGPKNPPNGEAK